MDGKLINPLLIQKEIEQALEEKRLPMPVSSPLPLKPGDKNSPARTPGKWQLKRHERVKTEETDFGTMACL